MIRNLKELAHFNRFFLYSAMAMKMKKDIGVYF